MQYIRVLKKKNKSFFVSTKTNQNKFFFFFSIIIIFFSFFLLSVFSIFVVDKTGFDLTNNKIQKYPNNLKIGQFEFEKSKIFIPFIKKKKKEKKNKDIF